MQFSENSEWKVHKFPGGYGREATPVPIPNTEVKLSNADGTWDAGPWESRTPPGVSLILDSSTVEYAAVNRGVVGSNPTRGARAAFFGMQLFLYLLLSNNCIVFLNEL